MSDAPERIYLNLGNEETTYGEAFREGAEISWCADAIDEWDVAYIRADIAEAKIAELEAQLRPVTQSNCADCGAQIVHKG